MTTPEAALLGAVQGLTEFLPVSSSGHLYLLESWLGHTPNLGFEVWVHAATFLAVVVYFWRDLLHLTRDFLGLTPDPQPWLDRLGVKLLLATALTVGVALWLEPHFEGWLTRQTVGYTLIITGLMIALAENAGPHRQVREFSYPIVVLLGLVQGLAVVPGISRSGLTIAFLILLGIGRVRAAELSFLLAIPTIAGAVVFALRDTATPDVFSPPMLTAGLTAFVTGWLSIRWMMRLVQGKWLYFAPYCIGLGGAVLVFLT